MRKQVADRRRVGVEGREGICAERWGVESGNNPVASQYTGSRAWRKVEDSRTDY